ncbi:hypothetical protein ACOME3_002738 [Neoechinorhynchus agilis]
MIYVFRQIKGFHNIFPLIYADDIFLFGKARNRSSLLSYIRNYLKILSLLLKEANLIINMNRTFIIPLTKTSSSRKSLMNLLKNTNDFSHSNIVKHSRILGVDFPSKNHRFFINTNLKTTFSKIKCLLKRTRHLAFNPIFIYRALKTITGGSICFFA